MKKPGGVTAQIVFNKRYRANVYKNSFSSDMIFNFTLILPIINTNTSQTRNETSSNNATSANNATSSSNVTSARKMTSSLEIMMKGSSGVVIAGITTHDYKSLKWGGRKSYVYIPEGQEMWTHRVNLTVGQCDEMRIEVCLRGLFSSKQTCQVKEVRLFTGLQT